MYSDKISLLSESLCDYDYGHVNDDDSHVFSKPPSLRANLIPKKNGTLLLFSMLKSNSSKRQRRQKQTKPANRRVSNKSSKCSYKSFLDDNDDKEVLFPPENTTAEPELCKNEETIVSNTTGSSLSIQSVKMDEKYNKKTINTSCSIDSTATTLSFDTASMTLSNSSQDMEPKLRDWFRPFESEDESFPCFDDNTAGSSSNIFCNNNHIDDDDCDNSDKIIKKEKLESSSKQMKQLPPPPRKKSDRSESDVWYSFEFDGSPFCPDFDSHQDQDMDDNSSISSKTASNRNDVALGSQEDTAFYHRSDDGIHHTSTRNQSNTLNSISSEKEESLEYRPDIENNNVGDNDNDRNQHVPTDSSTSGCEADENNITCLPRDTKNEQIRDRVTFYNDLVHSKCGTTPSRRLAMETNIRDTCLPRDTDNKIRNAVTFFDNFGRSNHRTNPSPPGKSQNHRNKNVGSTSDEYEKISRIGSTATSQEKTTSTSNDGEPSVCTSHRNSLGSGPYVESENDCFVGDSNANGANRNSDSKAVVQLTSFIIIFMIVSLFL